MVVGTPALTIEALGQLLLAATQLQLRCILITEITDLKSFVAQFIKVCFYIKVFFVELFCYNSKVLTKKRFLFIEKHTKLTVTFVLLLLL